MPEPSVSPSPALLIRLDRAATGLEAEGYFGAAKLCRALSQSMLRRAAYESGIPRLSSTLEQELSALIAELERSGANPAAVAALRTSQQATRENRPATWEEAPLTRLCRWCGELFVGDAPEYCPTCGSHALTFQEILPIFYLEPLPPMQIIAALDSMPDVLEEAVTGMDEAQLTTAPSAGEWSMRDVLWHLSVAQGMMTGRVDRMLAQDNPSLEAQATWAVGADEPMTTHDMFDRFRRKRQETVALLRGLSFDQWLRPGRHTEFGPITIQQQMSYMAKHERYHLPQLHRLRQTITGTPPTT